RLLDVALGPSRERAVLEVPDVVRDPRLATAEAPARETGIGSALAAPLVARGEVIGLLAAYPAAWPVAGEHEIALLAALAGHFAAAVRAILTQPVPFGQRNVQRLFRDRLAFRLQPTRGRGEHFLPALVPFLEKGWTGAVVPVALPTEVVASLGIFSFRPGEPVSEETVDAAAAIAAQAALALDNARLYQLQ